MRRSEVAKDEHGLTLIMSLLFPRFVDSAVPLSKAQRKIARGRAWSKWRLNRWSFTINLATTGSINGAFLLAFLYLNQRIPSVMRGVGIVFIPGAFLVVPWLSFRLLRHFRYAPHYRRAVRELGIDVCVSCGYWLRGLDDQVRECPECGWSRPPDAVSPREPLLWDAEARRALAEVGFEPCSECGVLCKVRMKHCPVCGAKRTLKADAE